MVFNKFRSDHFNFWFGFFISNARFFLYGLSDTSFQFQEVDDVGLQLLYDAIKVEDIDIPFIDAHVEVHFEGVHYNEIQDEYESSVRIILSIQCTQHGKQLLGWIDWSFVDIAVPYILLLCASNTATLDGFGGVPVNTMMGINN